MNKKPVIRSITYFTEAPAEQGVLDYTEALRNSILPRAVETIRKISEILEAYGYNVWTKRITLPLLSNEYYHHMDSILDTMDEYLPKNNIMGNIGGLYIDQLGNHELIISIVERGYYTGLLWRDNPPIDLATDIFLKISEAKPEYATRIAVSLNGQSLMTPYYPLSSNLMSSEAVGLALLYPEILKSIYVSGGLEGIEEYLLSTHDELTKLVAEEAGVEVFIDHSISPWMNNSVAELLETITGEKFHYPGIIDGVKSLNSIIRSISGKRENIMGFNEVMLPYAEDSRLIEIGGKGLIRARDLLYLSTICVAGPDMIVAPNDKEMLRSFIKASFTLGIDTGRVKALRIIPVSEKPGNLVDLGRFGKIPVIDY